MKLKQMISFAKMRFKIVAAETGRYESKDMIDFVMEMFENEYPKKYKGYLFISNIGKILISM